MILLKNILYEYSSSDLIKKYNLTYDSIDPVKTKIIVGDLILSKKSIYGALQDIKNGNTSKTQGLITVMYDINKNVFIITDGWHRFVQMLLKGLKAKDIIPIILYSKVYNDYYSIPSGNNIFNIKTDKKFN